MKTPPSHLPFDATFRATFRDLVLWRRDVRRFRTDPVDDKLIDDLIEIATHAPSVGLSQPWRFVKVQSAERRRAVWESFAKANARAQAQLFGHDSVIQTFGAGRHHSRPPCPCRQTARPFYLFHIFL